MQFLSYLQKLLDVLSNISYGNTAMFVRLDERKSYLSRVCRSESGNKKDRQFTYNVILWSIPV